MSTLNKIKDTTRGAFHDLKNSVLGAKRKLTGETDTVSRSERFDAISVLLGRLGTAVF
jgi:hypothetical protein